MLKFMKRRIKERRAETRTTSRARGAMVDAAAELLSARRDAARTTKLFVSLNTAPRKIAKKTSSQLAAL